MKKKENIQELNTPPYKPVNWSAYFQGKKIRIKTLYAYDVRNQAATYFNTDPSNIKVMPDLTKTKDGKIDYLYDD